jgi:hypothetical protein
MSAKTDFYLGRGPDAEWIGSLQWDCHPHNLLRVPPGHRALTAPDEAPVVLPILRGSCGFTGIDAADTLARRYGPLLGDTYDLDLYQLAVRILADLTLVVPPLPPDDGGDPFTALPFHLGYAITTDESAVELEIEVFGYRDGDPAALAAEALLATLPARYGLTDPDGGPPRFGVRVAIADDDRLTAHPVLAYRRTRAVLSSRI